MNILVFWGYLTLMDSIYDINKLKWKFFILIVCNKYNSWYLSTNILFSNKDSDIISAFL